jgi:proteic killer suppression protein
MTDIFDVILSPLAKKALIKMPEHIVRKLTNWADFVEKFGLSQAQKIPGYNDEPLKGKRFGQRSIRLNKAYRAIYVKKKGEQVEFLEVEEVSKHDY